VTDPGMALAWFAVGAAVVLGVVWPRRGLLALVRRMLRQTERVQLEDALKCMHHADYAGRPCTVEVLAGVLEVSRSRALGLASRLEARGLARTVHDELELTEAGEAYAGRIVRTHRLWERYLADRTGVDPSAWHEEAERREHDLTRSETERLAARLGHPVYDPHGDPIPTKDGEIPRLDGVPLTQLEEGDVGVIVHIEDEPQEVYDRLLAEELTPRMHVVVRSTGPGGVEFEAGGRRHELDRLVAANVTVVPVALPAEADTGGRTLVDLEPGEVARVVGLTPTCRGPQRRRLLDLGIVPGTGIRAELRSTSGDPVAYRVRGALIALRREQASWVRVEVDADEGEAVA